MPIGRRGSRGRHKASPGQDASQRIDAAERARIGATVRQTLADLNKWAEHHPEFGEQMRRMRDSSERHPERHSDLVEQWRRLREWGEQHPEIGEQLRRAVERMASTERPTADEAPPARPTRRTKRRRKMSPSPARVHRAVDAIYGPRRSVPRGTPRTKSADRIREWLAEDEPDSPKPSDSVINHVLGKRRAR